MYVCMRSLQWKCCVWLLRWLRECHSRAGRCRTVRPWVPVESRWTPDWRWPSWTAFSDAESRAPTAAPARCRTESTAAARPGRGISTVCPHRDHPRRRDPAWRHRLKAEHRLPAGTETLTSCWTQTMNGCCCCWDDLLPITLTRHPSYTSQVNQRPGKVKRWAKSLRSINNIARWLVYRQQHWWSCLVVALWVFRVVKEWLTAASRRRCAMPHCYGALLQQ